MLITSTDQSHTSQPSRRGEQ